MSLQLHLQVNERGIGQRLYAFDGDKLVGEIPATIIRLRAYDVADRGRASLTIHVGSRNFTVEVVQ